MSTEVCTAVETGRKTQGWCMSFSGFLSIFGDPGQGACLRARNRKSLSLTRRGAGWIGCMKQQQAPKLSAALRVACRLSPVACRATGKSALLRDAASRALALVRYPDWTRDQASQQHGLSQSSSDLTEAMGRGMSVVVAGVLSCARGDRQLRWTGYE